MKQYIVKRFPVNPFSADMKDALVLCDKETMEPFCDIESGSERVKEGDVLDEGSFKVHEVSKKTKHITAGDIVLTKDMMMQGRVDRMEADEYDFYSSTVHLVDCGLSRQGKLFEHTMSSVPVTMALPLREVTPRYWITATIPCPCCGR